MTDAVVGSQQSLFDLDEKAPKQDGGYRGPEVCQITGVIYRQLDYWTRTNLVTASICSARGSGSQRSYSFGDVLRVKIIARLLDTGIGLRYVRSAMEALRGRGTEEISAITLLSDGSTVYQCTEVGEIIDLLAGGQGVFAIAVPGLVAELAASVSKLPADEVPDLGAYRRRIA